MTFAMCINLQKVNEWKLRLRTIPVMGVFADLESWATRHKSNDVNDDNIYYLLYREKILAELPFLGSVSTISRSIKELEDKGIIKCINKNTTPAYCLTEKGISWKRKPEIKKNANDGESKPPKLTAPKDKKPHKFQFTKKTALVDLPAGYIEHDLYTACLEAAQRLGVVNGRLEYEKFIEHNSMIGGAWVNWLSAFSSWCRKHKELQKNQNGDDDERGLYR
ncbi:MAG: hypothetical protein V2A75_08090 [Pseudomonadota bacterium]